MRRQAAMTSPNVGGGATDGAHAAQPLQAKASMHSRPRLASSNPEGCMGPLRRNQCKHSHLLVQLGKQVVLPQSPTN